MIPAVPTRTETSSQKSGALRARSKELAVSVIMLSRSLKGGAESKVVTNQLVRSATSVAANYRAVCRARSKREFVSKLGIVIEEADETLFWLEMLVDLGDVSQARVDHLTKEANELISIFVASKRTAEQSTIDNRQSTTGNPRSAHPHGRPG